MIITLRGVRGSLPSPGPDTITYGGNTTCLDIVTADGERIIIDGGSGVRGVGEELAITMPIECSFFITHTHWDHIHGLPFFIPLFVPGNSITIYGPPDPVSMNTMQDALAVQMTYRYFPVREAELKSNLKYETLMEGQTVQIGSTTITSVLMNHSVINFGYKIEENGKSFFFSGDHEPHRNIYSPDDEEYAEYQHIMDEKTEDIVSFIRGCDCVVLDSQYTEEEYPAKIGWGHSTFDQSIKLARRAEVKRALLTHHDPARTDAQLEAIEADLLDRYAGQALDFAVAREGTRIEL